MNQHPTEESLIDYLHGELLPQDDAFVHAHLGGCDACRASYDAEASVTEMLRSSALAAERDFPSLVAAAVWQQIREAPPSPLTRLTAFLRPAVAVPVAALLVAGVWLASPLGHGAAPARSIDAMYYLQAHAAQTAAAPFSERPMPALETSTADVEPAAPPLVDRYAAYAMPGGIDAVR